MTISHVERDEHEALAALSGYSAVKMSSIPGRVTCVTHAFPLFLVAPALGESELLHVEIDGPVDVGYVEHGARIPLVAQDLGVT